MRKFWWIATLLILCGASMARADTAMPRFEDYAVNDGFSGKPVKVRIVSAEDRKYAARLREVSRQKVNFAGHYVLASWGCGASCLSTVAIDAVDGRVTWLPFTVCCWDADVAEPIGFRRDSRLIVVRGSRDEAGGGTYYYALENRGFELVRAVEKGK